MVDLPGVGENLQDHLNVRMCWASKIEQQIPMIICESSLFTFTRDGVPNASPDLQLFFGGFAFPGLGADFNKGFALVPVVCRPQSVGRVWLKSTNPMDALNIQTNYLTSEYDMSVLLAGIKLGREIVQTKAFNEIRGAELLPGPDVGSDPQKLRKYIKDTCITDWHPSGTCHMGLDTHGRGRFEAEGLRSRWTADGGRIDHAVGRQRQSAGIDFHDRRKGRRHDPKGR